MKRYPKKTSCCRVLGCGAALAMSRNLFCPRHWQWLPEHLRAGLLAAGRAMDRAALLDARGKALVWYADPANRTKAEPQVQEARVPYGD